jgi:hypothetical protein
MTAKYAEIELGLHRWDKDAFEVDFRFSDPDSDADVRPTVSHPVMISLQALRALADDRKAYETLLTEYLFSDPAIAREFRKARDISQAKNQPIRLRLRISPTAEELHAIRWEMLLDPLYPEANPSLLTNQNILFSRYINSAVPMPVRKKPEGKLKALAVIASPSGLDNVITHAAPLADINIEEELVLAKERLKGFETTFIAQRGTATVDNIIETLRSGAYDLLYVVSHGIVVRDQACLLLEQTDGTTDRVTSVEIVNELRELRELPRLIVLAVCQSGGFGSGSPGELAFRLGPKLAEAGAPAVVAMQGNVSIETASSFLQAFFGKLSVHGEIDRAMAEARAHVRDNPDYWMPVLYMRLRAGMMWLEPDSARRSGRTFSRWNALIPHIRAGNCTPIIGFGAYETLFGSSRSLARRWAETYRYPFRIDYGDDLPQVAQFLAVNNDPQYPRYELQNHFRREIHRRFAQTVVQDDPNEPIDALITRAWSKMAGKNDPHRILARLQCPLYVTTHVSGVMEKALEEAGRKPYSAICRWDETLMDGEKLPATLQASNPLVYHLFGRLGRPDDPLSMVMSEDDYFDYLIGTTRNKELVPESVRSRLARTALLFLGFQVNDWSFRVLFRSIMTSEGRALREKFSHVAVQIDPDQAGMQEPELAEAYLEQYFEDSKITIFRGTVAEFTTRLAEEWRLQVGEELLTAKG